MEKQDMEMKWKLEISGNKKRTNHWCSVLHGLMSSVL